ncbi:HAD family hydrolase [Shewanella sp. D64]|uniref:HAD family hydrolase n=1 Tax=unclassified Shewanella TaxID=196818 RepID=UPI0022BA116F|nr:MULTISPECIES: HAD family hydrolase [unclassified Shewanella]MEC4725488.1 HAD family hydrolase [Shewanella sp. D64]MEC4738693.1 HAD family hydrolase [Shewanella sp. E94]WBJ94989.1 HAD family hydrolase [Shewanella sp. MTB7]
MSITVNSYFDFSRIQGVIFDLDGTLADSNPDFEGLRLELSIKPGADILGYIESISDPKLAAQAKEIVERYELESSNKATWIAGAEQLIELFTALQLPLAILTRNIPAAAAITLANLGLEIDLVLTRFDAKAKPHPEGVELICQKWQLEPANILFIGDYLYDLQTANNAGTKSVLYSPALIPDYASEADIVCRCYTSLIEYFKTQIRDSACC